MMERPSLTLTIGEHELRWTYGLQLDIQRVIPDAEAAVSAILSDTYTRDYLIRRVMTPLKRTVEDTKELIAVEDIDLDPDQQLEILDWVSGHILHFFVISAKNLSAKGEAFRESLPSKPSITGSET